MNPTSTSTGPVRRIDPIATHAYAIPVVRELPRPPAAAGLTGAW
jgi:hypothetical protein